MDVTGVAPLVVMTANVRTAAAPDLLHPWVRRRHAFVTVVRDADPDVCGLQEPTPSQFAWLTSELGDEWDLHGEGRRGTGRGEHVGTAVRRSRVRVDDVRTRWLSDTPDVPGSRSWGNHYARFAVFSECTDLDADRPFTVITTHLDHASKRSRERSAEVLAAWLAEVAGDAWVLLGDFNTTPDDDALAPLWAAGGVDALGALPPKGEGAGTFHGYRGHRRGRRIDHVVVGPGWEVLDARIVHDRPGGRLASDHWPVVARLGWLDASVARDS